MSRVLGRPPRAPRSHPVKPGAQASGSGKGSTASGRPTAAPRATGPDEARRTTRGHEARQRGTSPATTNAHGQVPGNNGRRVPRTRRARKTHNKPRHRNRCQATPAAVQMDECALGGYPAPTGYGTAAVRMDECAPGGYSAPAGYEQPPSGWTSAHPEGTQPLPAKKSRRPDGRVSAPQRRPAQQHPTRNPKHSTQSEHTGEQEPSGPGHHTHNTTHRAGTGVNRSQRGPGHRARDTTQWAGTPANRSQVAQDTAHTTQRTEQAHR